MDRIPPLGWVALAFILILFIGINVNLLSMLRDLNRKETRPSQMKMQRPSTMLQSLDKARELLRDPIADEREQLEELSSLVHELQARQPSGEKEPDKPDTDPPGQ